MANYIAMIPSGSSSLDISGQDGTKTLNINDSVFFVKQDNPWNNMALDAPITGIPWPVNGDTKLVIVASLKTHLAQSSPAHNLLGAFFLCDGDYVNAITL